MIVVFIGPPYAGKDTQAKLLSQKLNSIPIFSMGHLIRAAREQGVEHIVQAYEQYSMKGLHLPTSIKFDLLREKMNTNREGFILDNFPATEEDLYVFTQYLKDQNMRVDKVIYIKISEEEMDRRFKEASRGRLDDTFETIHSRRLHQDEDRKSVLDQYLREGKLVEIEGEGSVMQVHGKILESLGVK